MVSDCDGQAHRASAWKWNPSSPFSKYLPGPSSLQFTVLIKHSHEEGEEKHEVWSLWPLPHAVSKLLRSSLVSSSVCKYSLAHEGKDEKLISFQLQNAAYFYNLRLAGKKGRLGAPRPNRKQISEDPRSAQAAPRAEDVHSTAKRKNTGSSSEGNQSRSGRHCTWSQTSGTQINQGGGQIESGQSLDGNFLFLFTKSGCIHSKIHFGHPARFIHFQKAPFGVVASFSPCSAWWLVRGPPPPLEMACAPQFCKNPSQFSRFHSTCPFWTSWVVWLPSHLVHTDRCSVSPACGLFWDTTWALVGVLLKPPRMKLEGSVVVSHETIVTYFPTPLSPNLASSLVILLANELRVCSWSILFMRQVQSQVT